MNDLNLDWHKCRINDKSTFPNETGKYYFAIVDECFQVVYCDATGFRDVAFYKMCFPSFWAKMPKYNLPDEMLLDMIK